MWWHVCALAALTLGAVAELTLTGPRCGDLACRMDQYCSPETSRCAGCVDVCERNNHNYDAGLCVKMCQDYIHELRFVSRTASGGAVAAGGASADDVRSLQLQVKIALFISSLLLAVVVAVCLFKCYRFARNNKGKFTWKYIKKKLQFSKKSRVKHFPTDLTHHNPHAEVAKSPKRDLKIEMRAEPAPSARRNPDADSAPRTVSTCVGTRHPAEDTTLDYSYDNMALNVTPPPASAAAQHF